MLRGGTDSLRNRRFGNGFRRSRSLCAAHLASGGDQLLVKAFRLQQITRQELFKYAERLARLRVTVDFAAAERAFEQVISLAERYQLTTYDASYLELAQRRGLPIASVDGNLVQAAAAVRVPVLKP